MIATGRSIKSSMTGICSALPSLALRRSIKSVNSSAVNVWHIVLPSPAFKRNNWVGVTRAVELIGPRQDRSTPCVANSGGATGDVTVPDANLGDGGNTAGDKESFYQMDKMLVGVGDDDINAIPEEKLCDKAATASRPNNQP